jgi:NAD(P)-dependent dehydrogenase (short-subunit alcohol dehydrogenase family)
MELKGKVIIVTGAANGIGKAMVRRFHREQPEKIVLVDIDEEGLRVLADELDRCTVFTCDISREEEVSRLIAETEATLGRIDLYCGNAGILRMGGVDTPNDDFQRVWDINVQSHIYAARAALPKMIERGEGYFLITASAAGMLTQLGSLSYSMSKHAALSFAEWLAISHGHQGIKVSALCPQAVESNMTAGTDGSVAGIDGMLPATEVADCVLEALTEEQFLVLPHPEVKQYFQNKAGDYGRWIGGMKKLQRQFEQLSPENVETGSEGL